MEHENLDLEQDEKETYQLTTEAIMQMVLGNFNIEVNIVIARAIFDELMRQLEYRGYVEKNDDSMFDQMVKNRKEVVIYESKTIFSRRNI